MATLYIRIREVLVRFSTETLAVLTRVLRGFNWSLQANVGIIKPR
jgi:hypothetical protein